MLGNLKYDFAKKIFHSYFLTKNQGLVVPEIDGVGGNVDIVIVASNLIFLML